MQFPQRLGFESALWRNHQHTGNAKVHHFNRALLANHNIARLNIAVNNAHAVRIFQALSIPKHNLAGIALVLVRHLLSKYRAGFVPSRIPSQYTAHARYDQYQGR